MQPVILALLMLFLLNLAGSHSLLNNDDEHMQALEEGLHKKAATVSEKQLPLVNDVPVYRTVIDISNL